MSENDNISAKTIKDFGDQWTRYSENNGFYASGELFGDIVGPLAGGDDFKGCRVIDLGSGSGRIVGMLIGAGAASVCAVEPSDAFRVLQLNTRAWADRIRYVNAPGDKIPADETEADWVVSIGVLHHIPEPDPVVTAAFRALKPGGRMLVWLYGKEGNEVYLALALPLRWISSRLPARLLAVLSHVVTALANGYVGLCRHFPKLPLAGYAVEVFGKLDYHARFLSIYDQLNPTFAKYYRKAEATALLEKAGFINVEGYHRHGYSWTVIGEKPASN